MNKHDFIGMSYSQFVDYVSKHPACAYDFEDEIIMDYSERFERIFKSFDFECVFEIVVDGNLGNRCLSLDCEWIYLKYTETTSFGMKLTYQPQFYDTYYNTNIFNIMFESDEIKKYPYYARNFNMVNPSTSDIEAYKKILHNIDPIVFTDNRLDEIIMLIQKMNDKYLVIRRNILLAWRINNKESYNVINFRNLRKVYAALKRRGKFDV